MPRDGSGVYSKPAGIDASPNTTIESADWNAFTADVEQDLNTPRPVIAGGSGSATAVGGNDNLSKAGADMASATTLNLATATGTQINVTGTTTITSLGTVAAGAVRELIFAGSLTLTHNATTLILPGAANIQTAAGDVARFRSLGGGNWRCMSYQRANGQPIGALNQPTLTLKQSAAPTPTAEGDIQWDTDDNVLVIGDGAAQQIFVPLPASVAAGDVFYATSAKALARIAKGTAGQVFRMNAGATAPQWGGGAGAPTAVIEDQKVAGTDGGTINSGSWVQRDLNTETFDPYNLVTVASNQFTVSADGWVEWSAPGAACDRMQTRLFNVTDGVAVGYGIPCSLSVSGQGNFVSSGGAPVVSGKTYRVEQRVASSRGTNGLGYAANLGGTEVFTRVLFWRTA
ncbi:hypothetical protein EN866_33055 [Mesorhizobium sp. M2D.F.Ca.ET.223.01.1.1]|uniref:hypothetical protein n=1 Tax=Mesorhizobium sp. M2D.F.Ca.ET.223.01.1.1 TaxID=2563940 RepID=UPI0010920AC7|nr:hypothetical protein [Mesorhizobium sp. M2D.F.Ca.ET.223.01.1.1]TGR84580.1 hypothetical protein EN866_33055 [Mesorhizobium sp. M2D.F.Ca.ET.223.01.1.1]TGT75162.1 hypothetical protein EN802_09155 [bacterium M00.F.Ca.ET.159.01.1.1]TGT88029.1 hypothetical protein EN800_06045 [bacterium M00.F.Ca.ET.157.01.1.1]